MHEVIDGVLYDTDASTLICKLVNKSSSHDEPNFLMGDAALYQTLTGKYFVAGYYTVSKPQVEQLKVISPEIAKKLTGKYANVSIYRYFFGEPEIA